MLCPGEGVLLTPNEIFSFRDRSLVTSASAAASRADSRRFCLSSWTMWFVATKRPEHRDRGCCGKTHTSLQQRYFAALLVRYGEHILQSRIPIAQLIAPTLFSLDALSPGRLLARACDLLNRHHAVWVVVVRVCRTATSSAAATGGA